MKIAWTERAREDIFFIGLYKKKFSPVGATEFIRDIRKRIAFLTENPRIGRMIPEINNPDIRELLYKRYRVVYRIKPEQIDILTIFEGHKPLDL